MDNQLGAQLKQIIEVFNQSLMEHLPALTSEVSYLIKNKTTDFTNVEYYLDTLLSLTDHGVGEDLFIQLLEYYETVDADGAMYYWGKYVNDE